MAHRLLGTTAAAALVVGIAACGDDDDDDGAGTTDTTPVVADLVVQAVPTIQWAEDEYTVAAGEVTVALEQRDPSAQHTLAIVDEAGTEQPTVLEVDEVGDTDTGTYTLTAGTYTLICTVPGHDSMRATLIVS